MPVARGPRSGAGSAATRPIRPPELNDALNRHFYHPLAWRLARLLAATPVTPNMVSVAGGLAIVAAGLAYAGPLWGWSWPGSAAAGLALHMSWHVLDGADGDLARLTERSSPRGEMIDGLCDYAGHLVLYLLLAALLATQIGWVGWPIMIATGVTHAIQANHVEVQRRYYLHWVHAKPWLANERPEMRGPAAWLVALYLRAAGAMSPHAEVIDRAVIAAADDRSRRAALRAMIREQTAPLLRLEKVLGPNPRTIALGLSMLITGSPLAFAAYGAIGLTALLAVSVAVHNRAARRIAQRIAVFG